MKPSRDGILSGMSDPAPSRPHVPDYGIPESTEGLLDFDYVLETFREARNFWLVTVRPDGRPHAMPVWGVVVDGRVHFGGGPNTRKAKNLKANPAIVVHSESGEQVAIIEGRAKIIDESLQERIDDAYEVKYDMRHGPYVWQVDPDRAFGWTKFPDDVTRWTF